MIKVKNGRVTAKGITGELLADLSFIIATMITEGKIAEELIDISVGLGKAQAKGNKDEYMKKTLEKRLEKMAEKIVSESTDKKTDKTMAVDLMGLIRQMKEEKEKEEDED